MRPRATILWTLVVLIAVAPLAYAQGLPTASPKSVGLSAERLDRITAVMRKHVDDGLLAGAVAMVVRDGKVAYLQSVGMRDKEQQVEMGPDAVFRIASMSKPITSVAVMMLYEEGRFQLKDPISDYARFAQMLLNGGELDGVRLLSPTTVKMMTTDQVGELKSDSGFGLGFGVTRTLREAGELTSVGAYRWGGFWYTTFFIDPAQRMVGVCMAQLSPSGKATLNDQFEALAHQAIVDSR